MVARREVCRNGGMRLEHAPAPTPIGDELTTRQHECLRLAAEGLSSAAIGERIGISSRTVDEHLGAACEALGVRTRVQAVARLAQADRRSESGDLLP